MHEFEPASPTYAISDTIAEHRLRGRDRTRADLPGGYQLTLRTRQLHGQLEAAPAAPSPTGPARICTARTSAHTPTPTRPWRPLPACSPPAPPSNGPVSRDCSSGSGMRKPGWKAGGSASPWAAWAAASAWSWAARGMLRPPPASPPPSCAS